MLLKTLRSNSPQSTFLSALSSLVIYGSGMFNEHGYQFQWKENSPLFHNLELGMLGWANQVIAFFLIFLTAFLFQHVCNKHELFLKRSQMPMFFLVLLLSLSPQAYSVSSLTLGALLVVSLLDYTFRIQQSNKPNDLLFLGALFAGTMSLIDTIYSIFIFLLLATYMVSGRREIKGLVILGVGFLLPIYFYSGGAYLLNSPIQFPFKYHFHLPQIGRDSLLLALVLVILMAVLSSINSFISALNFNKVVVKNNYILLICFGLLSVVIASSIDYGYNQGFSLAAFFIVPVLVNHFLRLKKEWIGSLELIILFSLSVIYNISQH